MIAAGKRRWESAQARLLAVRRRDWAIATVLCFAGWVALLASSGPVLAQHWWWKAADFPLNAGWVFCSAAWAGMLEQAFRPPRYVVSDQRPPFWKVAVEGLGALVLLALLVLLGGAAGYGMVVMLGGWGWALDGVVLGLLSVRTYYGVRRDLRARRAAREQWLAEHPQAS